MCVLFLPLFTISHRRDEYNEIRRSKKKTNVSLFLPVCRFCGFRPYRFLLQFLRWLTFKNSLFISIIGFELKRCAYRCIKQCACVVCQQFDSVVANRQDDHWLPLKRFETLFSLFFLVSFVSAFISLLHCFQKTKTIVYCLFYYFVFFSLFYLFRLKNRFVKK